MRKHPSKDLNSAEVKVTKFQAFEAVTIHRSQIKNAPYNPRRIDKTARKRLKDKLNIKSKHGTGLVETLVWNVRTGNLVSGHQRLSILDELEKSQDYNLTVAKVDLDAKREKELNVFLNNSTAQGEYDFDLLKDMFETPGIDPDAFGFDASEINWLMDNNPDQKQTDETTEAEELQKIAKVRAAKKNMKAKAGDRDSGEFFCVLVFQNDQELHDFYEAIGHPEIAGFYVDGHRALDHLGVDYGETNATE